LKNWRNGCLRIFWTILIVNRGPTWNDRCWTGGLVYWFWICRWSVVWKLFWDSKTVLAIFVRYDMDICNKLSWLIVQIDSRTWNSILRTGIDDITNFDGSWYFQLWWLSHELATNQWPQHLEVLVLLLFAKVDLRKWIGIHE
jgi:hypothetical protein